MGTNYSKANAVKICKTDGPTTLFLWDTHLKAIGATNFPGTSSLAEKQNKFVGYLLKKAYDLAISPAINVSRNPGFEVPFKCYGNKKP